MPQCCALRARRWPAGVRPDRRRASAPAARSRKRRKGSEEGENEGETERGRERFRERWREVERKREIEREMRRNYLLPHARPPPRKRSLLPEKRGREGERIDRRREVEWEGWSRFWEKRWRNLVFLSLSLSNILLYEFAIVKIQKFLSLPPHPTQISTPSSPFHPLPNSKTKSPPPPP